jgi:hypothetical protein
LNDIFALSASLATDAATLSQKHPDNASAKEAFFQGFFLM